MGRVSTKENKTIYQNLREELDLSREKASELLEGITPERLERIENEKTVPHPEEVLLMSDKYKAPDLCNYYCANECPIGEQYVPEVKMKDLSRIVLEMLSSLNSMNKQKDRLIDIAADGKIDNDEIKDFIYIQDELERISITVEALQLWAEKMMDDGLIDIELYNKYKNAKDL
ncbi:MAG: helix-turn-helix transcriptional regulator [Firmicutes bacterium]|nr:helix-turn-helix transcriptional regulator [Bacillota bacterium]MBQ6686719.1 helix-turn-helix transcriptional regulator [Bacillota bacterium]